MTRGCSGCWGNVVSLGGAMCREKQSPVKILSPKRADTSLDARFAAFPPRFAARRTPVGVQTRYMGVAVACLAGRGAKTPSECRFGGENFLSPKRPLETLGLAQSPVRPAPTAKTVRVDFVWLAAGRRRADIASKS